MLLVIKKIYIALCGKTYISFFYFKINFIPLSYVISIHILLKQNKMLNCLRLDLLPLGSMLYSYLLLKKYIIIRA
jgi:hypothetical protein